MIEFIVPFADKAAVEKFDQYHGTNGELVRCNDCKYGEPKTNMFGDDMIMCQNKQNPIGYEDLLMPPEFYCADGERRESE